MVHLYIFEDPAVLYFTNTKSSTKTESNSQISAAKIKIIQNDDNNSIVCYRTDMNIDTKTMNYISVVTV